ncbi:MAG: hypothetical protein AABX38_06630 [Candidatus Micrarchaeota archaeon]
MRERENTRSAKNEPSKSKKLFRYMLPLVASLAVFGFSIRPCKDEIIKTNATFSLKTSQTAASKANESKKKFENFWKNRQELREKLTMLQEAEIKENIFADAKVPEVRYELQRGTSFSRENFTFDFDDYKTSIIDIPKHMTKLEDGFYIKIANEFDTEYKIVKYNQPFYMHMEFLEDDASHIVVPVEFERSANEDTVMLTSSCKLPFMAELFMSEKTTGFYPNCTK